MTEWQILHDPDGTTHARSSEGALMSIDSRGHWSVCGLCDPPDPVVEELMATHRRMLAGGKAA